MKWLLIFVLVHTDELTVMQTYDDEATCRQHGAAMYKEFQVTYFCANMQSEVLLDLATKELVNNSLVSKYIDAAANKERLQR